MVLNYISKRRVEKRSGCNVVETLHETLLFDDKCRIKRNKGGKCMAPVDLDKFETDGTEPQGRPKEKWQSQIVDYLKENPEQAFSDKEIAEALGTTTATVNQACRKLVDKDMAERKSVDNKIYTRYTGE